MELITVVLLSCFLYQVWQVIGTNEDKQAQYYDRLFELFKEKSGINIE